MEGIDKARKMFLYIAPFLGIAFFKIWSSFGRSQEAMLIVSALMFLYSMVIILLAFRWDRPSYFDWSVGAYFAMITSFLFFWPIESSLFIGRYLVTGIYACLFAAAFFPPLLGMDPFTYHYAKKYTPEFLWNNPIFIKINKTMTFVWSILFAISLIVSLYPSLITRVFIPIALIVGFGLPFNLRFPNYYLRKLGLPSVSEIGESPEDQSDERSHITEQETVSRIVPMLTQPINRLNHNKGVSMKVLALNSSPRGDGQSKTELLLTSLIEGMRIARADVEVVDLRKKNIKNCIGCFSCWTKTPGKCILKDDMSEELFTKWAEVDFTVYATPLYHFTLNATMKTFVERTLPMLHPFFEIHDGKTHHPLRIEPPKTVFLSVAGFPEDVVFHQLSSWVKHVFGKNLIAEIYRPSAELLTVPFCSEKAKDILDATRQAGQELIESNQISQECMARITQPIMGSKETGAILTNLMWKTCIAAGMTPKEFEGSGLIPRPDSIESFMIIMPMGFNQAKAGTTKATLQFSFSGSVEGTCHFAIENGTIRSFHGEASNADLTILTPFDVWMDIMTGKVDGQQMFMAQKYKATGDFSLLMKMNQLFGKESKTSRFSQAPGTHQ